MALSQGWGVIEFARKAGIATDSASKLLKEAAKKAETAIANIPAVDALALSIPYGEGTVTLGKLQGDLVHGAISALAETPPNPREWSRRDQDGYNNAQRILRDAKALGLIRFGEAEGPKIPQPIRPVDPFEAQSKAGKRGEGEKSPVESSTVNDGADSSPTPPAPESPQAREDGE